MFSNDIEFKDKEYIKSEQLNSLRELILYVEKKSPFYKKVLKESGINVSCINSIHDLQKIPLTEKHHLQDNNKAFYCVDNSHIVDIVSTTGTTGNPIFSVLTKQDLDRLALNEAKSFFCANVSRNDIFQISVTLNSLFVAGMAYYLGITKLGAATIRAGMRNVFRQVQLIKKLNPTGIVTVPSFLIKLIECIKKEGISFDSLSIKKALLVGQTIRNIDFSLNELGKLIKEIWPIEIYSTYGNTEGSISFCECEYHEGGHEHPELIITEIVDDNGYVVSDGEIGELILTTLKTEGMPLLRYKTGDITFKLSDKCKCGRNSSRIGPVIARKNQMMKFKGVKIYPMAIENALLSIKDVCNYIIEVRIGNDFSDNITVKVGVNKNYNGLKEYIGKTIESFARVTPLIELFTIKEIDNLRTDGGKLRKPKFFVDKRGKNIC